MAFKVKVVKRPKDIKRVVKQHMKKYGEGYLTLVGLPSNATPYPDGTSVAMVATVHEFGADIKVTSKMRGWFAAHGVHLGTSVIHIPERSFLRSTVQKNQREYGQFLKTGLEKVAEGKLDGAQLAELLGLKVQGDIQKTIQDISNPPNSGFTIRMKGSSNPLIDTGHLAQSITFEVVEVTDND